MPRRAAAPPRLTALQLAVMQVLWSRDEASVTDVQRAMTGRRLALTTVATMLVRLEQRGLVSHRAEGRQYIFQAPWLVLFPGGAIFLTSLSLNLVGDWARDVFDPRLRS